MSRTQLPEILALSTVLLALALPAAADWQLRDIDKIEHSRSIYIVSFPFNRGFFDMTGGPGSERQPDGVVDSADVLVDWFTGGDGLCPGEPGNGAGFPDECEGILSLYTFVPDSAENPVQTFHGQTVRRGWDGRVMLLGESFSIEDPTDPKSVDEAPRGYIAIPTRGRFPTITTGTHDPTWGGGIWEIPEHRRSRNLCIFSLPWDSIYTNSRDLLWDSFDEPEHMEVITLFTFDTDPVTNPDQTWTVQSLRPCSITGQPGFIPDSGFDCGNGFCLTPGQGYMFQVVAGGWDDTVHVPLTTHDGQE